MKIVSIFGENLKKKLPEIVVTSLTLIAGLAWNDAFNTLINHYNPTEKTKGSYLYKFLYAFIITLLFIIIITVVLSVTSAFESKT